MKLRRLKHLDKLNSMSIPKDEFVIYGSAPLVLRGLKEKNNDLDVLVKDNLWDKLKVEYPNNINGDYIDVEGISFTHRSTDFFESMDNIMKKADVIDGYHIMNLEQTINWKEKTGAEKHVEDAKKIRDYLTNLENKIN